MDFTLKFLSAAPSYFKDLVSFIAAPKEFLTGRTEATESADIWPHALSFFACSGMIAYILNTIFKFLPLAQNPGLAGFIIMITIIGFGLVAVSVTAKVSWRAVGKRFPFEQVLLIQIYIFSVVMLGECGGREATSE
jgi:hypothetical protein